MNYNFDLRKNWAYLVFVLPYALLSLTSIVIPSIATVFEYNQTAITEQFQLYRLITMFFIDTNIISVLFTTYIVFMFFQFLREVMTQLKQTILILISMFLSGTILFLFSLQFSFGNMRVGFLFFTILFLFAIITALFLYREETLARYFITRLGIFIILNALIIFLNGIVLIFLHLIIATSVFIVLFIAYYFTKPRPGYML